MYSDSADLLTMLIVVSFIMYLYIINVNVVMTLTLTFTRYIDKYHEFPTNIRLQEHFDDVINICRFNISTYL